MKYDIDNFRRKMMKELKGGILGLLILKSIDILGRPTYGYEIKQLLKKLSENQVQLYDGTVYTLLRRFEKYNLVKSFWGKTKEELPFLPPRKYYVLTEKGRTVLNLILEDYKLLDALVKKLNTPNLAIDRIIGKSEN